MGRPKKLPANVRRHGTGYRGVVTVTGERTYGPSYDFPEDAAKWVLDFRAGRLALEASTLDLTLADGLRLIERELDETAAKPPTYDMYRNHGRVVFAKLGGADTLLRKLSPDRMRRFVKLRLDEGISPSTIVGKEVFIIRRLWKLANKIAPLPPDPTQDLRLPKVRQARYHFLSKAQVHRIVAAIRNHKARLATRDADFVEFLWLTGMRRAEMSRVSVDDIDLETNRIWLDGKADDRYATIGPASHPVMRRIIAGAKPSGLLTTWRTIEKLFERWKDRLSLPHFSPHVMRHSFGTEMARHVTLLDLQWLMGHSNPKQTSRYFHGTGAAVESALDALTKPSPTPKPSS